MTEQWSVRCLSHFTLAVRNLEKSIEFYKKVGFQMIHDRRDAVWPASVAENFGMRVAQGRGVLMATDSGELHTRLDLIEWLAPTLPDATAPVEERVPTLIALLTENVVAAHADLQNKGIEFIVLRDDVEHQNLGIKAVSLCRDPDGNLLEFIEYMPGLRNSQPQNLNQRSPTTDR
ncbi:MAG: VOC family protein [Ilumatobacteraceae bacterium]